MKNLQSGMVLEDNLYGSLHYLITTPIGYRVITVDGECVEFKPKRYKKAYIPKAYDDLWTPVEGTIVELFEEYVEEDDEIAVTNEKEKLYAMEICKIQRTRDSEFESALMLNDGDLGYMDMYGDKIKEIWDVRTFDSPVKFKINKKFDER